MRSSRTAMQSRHSEGDQRASIVEYAVMIAFVVVLGVAGVAVQSGGDGAAAAAPIKTSDISAPPAQETATEVKATDLVRHEEQSISNDASVGTFTLSFDGEGPTGNIAFDAAASVIETELELLSNITDVSVTGSGTSGDPWVVTFLDPKPKDVELLTADDTNLGGGSTDIAEEVAGLLLIDPSGIAYLSHKDAFLISDSEINEEPAHYDGFNMWELTQSILTNATGVSPEPGSLAKKEPTGLAYNPSNNHVFITNDLPKAGTGERFVYEIDPGADGFYGTGDDVVTSFSTTAFGANDPEDILYDWALTPGDTSDDSLFLADGATARIFRIRPGPNGKFDGTDDIVTSFVLADMADIHDADGLEYRASSDTILVIESGPNDDIHEVTKDGHLLRTIDISGLKRVGINLKPADLTLAPASDDPGLTHMYLVDRGDDNTAADPDGNSPPEDGILYELTAPFNNLAPFVDAGPDLGVGLAETPTLAALVYDDGQPNPAPPTVTWSQLSGPVGGTANFGSPNETTTTVSFNKTGTYVVQIQASDTSLTTEQEVEIRVFPNPPVNQPPIVSAGSDRAITLPEVVNLDGLVVDDGLPNPPAAVTTEWTKVSGPGAVVFGDASIVDTTASFSTAGVYVLRLSADDNDLTDSDVVTITVNAADSGFVDIDGSVFKADIEWLAAEGITKGCNPPLNDRFCPDDNVTRGQMAAFLVRALGYTDNGGGNLFIDDDGSIFQEDIDRLGTAAVTKGCNPPINDRFCPDDNVTRGQMAAFLHRALG